MSRFAKHSRLAVRAAWRAILSSGKQLPEKTKTIWHEFQSQPAGDKFITLGFPVTVAGFAYGIAYDISHWHLGEPALPMTVLAGFGTPMAYFTAPFWLPVASVAVPIGYVWRNRVLRKEREENEGKRSRKRRNHNEHD